MSCICGSIFILTMVSSSLSQLMFQLWKFIIRSMHFALEIHDASYKHVFFHNVAFLGNTSCMLFALDMSTLCIMKTCFIIIMLHSLEKYMIHGNRYIPTIHAFIFVIMVYSLKETSYMEISYTSLKHVFSSHVYSLKESLYMEMHHTRI